MIELDVTGMTCGGCAKAVEKVVLRRDPVAKVEVDLAAAKVRIDSARPAAEFAEAIAAAGYEVAR